jgi:hypothetical protein
MQHPGAQMEVKESRDEMRAPVKGLLETIAEGVGTQPGAGQEGGGGCNLEQACLWERHKQKQSKTKPQRGTWASGSLAGRLWVRSWAKFHHLTFRKQPA